METQNSLTMAPLKKNFISIGFAVFLVAVLLALYATRTLVLAALIGIGFGTVVSPLMRLLSNRFKIPRAISGALLALIVIVSLGALGYGMYLLLQDQATRLIEQAPQIQEQLRSQVRTYMGEGWMQKQLESVDYASYGKFVGAALITGATTTLGALAGALVILMIGIYTAINSGRYVRGFLSVFPEYLRPRTREVMAESGKVLREWFKSQLIVMAITGSVTTLGLWILGVDYWLLLGILTGILGLIPYVGALITATLTGLVVLGSEPDKIWLVLGLYVLVQQLEGDLIMPLVMKGGVQLPEIHLIVLMLIMGSLFGLIGVFVAPPILTVARTIYLMTYVPKMDERTTSPKL